MPATLLTDQDGRQAFLILREERALATFEDGRQVEFPRALLAGSDGTGYTLPFAFAELERLAGTDERMVLRVPVYEEALQVGKRVVDAGGVRVTKTVLTDEQEVRLPVLHEEIEVQRVAVDRLVDGPQSIRTEGDTIIVPLLDEVLVVEKRLRVREEIHITRRATQREDVQRVAVRREDVTIDRDAALPSGGDEPSSPVL